MSNSCAPNPYIIEGIYEMGNDGAGSLSCTYRTVVVYTSQSIVAPCSHILKVRVRPAAGGQRPVCLEALTTRTCCRGTSIALHSCRISTLSAYCHFC